MGLISTINIPKCTIAIWEITESVDELLKLSRTINLPKFNTEKRTKEWIASRLLLRKINPSYSISYNIFGAPELNNNYCISISHSKGLAAIIISKQNVGMDIEKISQKTIRLASKFVSKNNLDNLTAEKATLIWCCKEAIFKWYQKGDVNFITDIQIDPFNPINKGEIKARFKEDRLILNYHKINNHYLVYVCK